MTTQADRERVGPENRSSGQLGGQNRPLGADAGVWECPMCFAENPGDEGCCYNCGADRD